jgi:hypothetical protein
MPWKINRADFEPGNPYVHFHDPSATLHLVTYLSNGTAELWIGAASPMNARLFIRISDDGPVLERAVAWTSSDRIIITSVLKSLGYTNVQKLFKLGNRPQGSWRQRDLALFEN